MRGTNQKRGDARFDGDSDARTQAERQEYKPITFHSEQVGQTIFENTFSGFMVDGRNGLFTHVDNSYTTLKLDSPDTNNYIITIEGK